jgi:N-methylhydantoinase A
MRVATDVGGTFTDLVYYRVGADGRLTGAIESAKADTTPPDFEQGVLQTLAKAGLDLAGIKFFAHGTTVVINALLSRSGARVGLITTKGFRDVLEIGRGNRPDLFNYAFEKPAPFVPRYLRCEVRERIDAHGAVLEPLDKEEVAPIVAHFKANGVEAVAICLLHAYANERHEALAVEAVRALWPGISIVPSHVVSREWREYERTSTTVLSAYVHPIARRYLGRMTDELKLRGVPVDLHVMLSNGGIQTARSAAINPIAMVESGPASGMLGASVVGHQIGESDVIALDIGGTTAKCSLIRAGTPHVTTEYRIEWTRRNPGYPIRTPVIDLVEIGNGGGSIAWIDDGGRLHVGPQSAGAMPGPAAYGRGGTSPTTTDANLLLGRIDPDLFAGGAIQPDIEAVGRAFRPIADRLDVSISDLARGIVRIANANMVGALKLVSLNRGYDPRDFTLIAFGGGGGMHAAFLAHEIGIRKIVLPVHGAVFSALGMLMTDLRRDHIRTRISLLRLENIAAIAAMIAQLEEEASQGLRGDGIPEDRQMLQRQADLRYRGQEHTVKIDLPEITSPTAFLEETARRFHSAHERAYRYRLEYPIEIVNFQVVAYGVVAKAELPRLAARGGKVAEAISGRRQVDFDHWGLHDAAVYDRAALSPGMTIEGPAVIQEPASTAVLPPGFTAAVDKLGNLHLTPPNSTMERRNG